MKLQAKILIPAVILIIVTLLAVVYFATFSKLVIVQDESWPLVMPKNSYFKLRTKLIKDRYRLSVEKIDQKTLWEAGYLEDSMLKLDSASVILLTPVVSAAVNEYDIDIKENMTNALVVGIGSDRGYFDFTLKSNDLTAWANAAKTAVSSDDIVAVIYDGNTVSQATVIYNNLDPEKAIKINSKDFGSLIHLEIPKLLEENKVSVVFTPGFEGMTDLFDDNKVKWVTDYRFSHVVPDKDLSGIVVPDIYNSIKEIINNRTSFIQDRNGEMQYEFRTVK